MCYTCDDAIGVIRVKLGQPRWQTGDRVRIREEKMVGRVLELDGVAVIVVYEVSRGVSSRVKIGSEHLRRVVDVEA